MDFIPNMCLLWTDEIDRDPIRRSDGCKGRKDGPIWAGPSESLFNDAF